MSGIGRIGGLKQIDRETPSEGFAKLEKSDRSQATPPRNDRVHEAAKLYEKKFLEEMVKAMRSTVSYSGTTKPSMAENIYRDQLDQQYVDVWGEEGGIGLSTLIYDQLMERFFNTPAGRGLRSQGGIELTDRDVSSVARMRPSREDAGSTAGQIPLKVETKPSEGGAPAKLLAPWEGEVSSLSKLGDKSLLTLDHGSGLKSTLIFKGVASGEMEKGRRIEKGQTIGILSPEAHSFFWNLNRPEGRPAGPDEGPAL